MEMTNFFLQSKERPISAMKQFVLILSPFAPHLAEELWATLGGETTLAYESWPEFDEAAIAESSVEVPVQIMGKVRARVTVPADCDAKTLEETALADKKVKELIEGKKIIKTIAVPGRMVNIVAK